MKRRTSDGNFRLETLREKIEVLKNTKIERRRLSLLLNKFKISSLKEL